MSVVRRAVSAPAALSRMASSHLCEMSPIRRAASASLFPYEVDPYADMPALVDSSCVSTPRVASAPTVPHEAQLSWYCYICGTRYITNYGMLGLTWLYFFAKFVVLFI